MCRKYDLPAINRHIKPCARYMHKHCANTRNCRTMRRPSFAWIADWTPEGICNCIQPHNGQRRTDIGHSRVRARARVFVCYLPASRIIATRNRCIRTFLYARSTCAHARTHASTPTPHKPYMRLYECARI